MSSIIAKVVARNISPQELLSHLSDPACGAEVLFLGTVRHTNHGRRVTALEYDAHIPLAQHTLVTICEESLTRYGPNLKIITIHRIGRLQVGDISVGIGVSGPHRDEAFRASRHIIEELKARAPIWKKEFYEDGESEWLKGCVHASVSDACGA